ncbi:hypothetical protein [Bradyrhizobium sp. RDT46]|uniref:hypothetical protein n=1 Tax=Bradyrhizobium sp. RDT46 TaxID=3341829 RepID=UPI0035C6EEC5
MVSCESELRLPHVPRLASHRLDLDLCQGWIAVPADEQIVAGRVAIGELCVIASAKQLAHYEIFARVAGGNARFSFLEFHCQSSRCNLCNAHKADLLVGTVRERHGDYLNLSAKI